jgi:hypothetical protein
VTVAVVKKAAIAEGAVALAGAAVAVLVLVVAVALLSSVATVSSVDEEVEV